MRVQSAGATIGILIVAALFMPLWKSLSVGLQTQNSNRPTVVGVVQTQVNKNANQSTKGSKTIKQIPPSASNPSITKPGVNQETQPKDPQPSTPPTKQPKDPQPSTPDSQQSPAQNPQRINVSLSAHPVSAEIGVAISFAATSTPANPNFRYRFIFGDGKQTEWQESSNTSYTYTAVNSYYPKVEVAFKGRESFVLGSAVFDRINIQAATSVPIVTPSPQPNDVKVESTKSNWPWYLIAIIVGAILIGGAYKILKSIFTPEPTFVAYPEIGSAAIKDAAAPSLVEFELNLNPNVAEGLYDIMTNAPSLIAAERGHP